MSENFRVELSKKLLFFSPVNAEVPFHKRRRLQASTGAPVATGRTSGNQKKQKAFGDVGYGRYYWRGFVDKTDGNYLVIFALPTIFHQDERYYAKGQGGPKSV